MVKLHRVKVTNTNTTKANLKNITLLAQFKCTLKQTQEHKEDGARVLKKHIQPVIQA